MTSPDWGPIFNQVHQVPGESPQKFSIEALAEQLGFIKRKNTADLAVAFGAIDLGDDWDPFGWFTDYVTEQTDAIANLNSITAAMGSTQAYVGDLQDMVTVPRWGLNAWGDGASPSVNILAPFVTFGGNYQNSCIPIYYPAVQPTVTTGDIYYTPIIVDRVGELGKLRWIVGSDPSIFSIDYYEMALCGYNPLNGNIEKIWGSGDIKDAEADVSFPHIEVEIDMGLTGQETTPGQILFVAHQQVAPGLAQYPRAFAAVQQPNTGRPGTTLLDAACFVAPAHSQGIPSSISLASLTRENRMIPWAAVTVS